MLRRFLPILLVLPLTACLTAKPRSMVTSSDAVAIGGVPVRTWGDNTCGSGALSAVLNFYGDDITEAELNERFPKGKFGGVVSLDLLLETRRRGFDSQLVKGSESLLLETLERGAPAILMLRVVDLPGEERDLFHYVIVDGHDPEKDLFRFQFGDGKVRWTRLDKLEKSWEGAAHATLLVEPIELAAGIRRAVQLEEKGNFEEARQAYERLLARDADSPLLWTNLGNVESRAGRRTEAEAAYRRAVELAPADRDALNNLAWLLFEDRRLEEALRFAERAVAAPGNDPHLALDTLGRIQTARGDCAGAEASFASAMASPTLDAGTRGELEKARADARNTCATGGS